MPPPTAEEVKRAERLLAIERSLSDAARDQRDLLREISTELGGQEKALTTAKKQYSSLRDISNEILRNEESETKLTKEQLDKLQAKSKTNLDYLKESAKRLYTEKGVRGEINTGMVDRLKFLNKISSEEEALLRAAADGFAVEEETLKLIDARIKKTENLNKATGITGDFLKISETLLEKIGAKNLQKPFEAARKAAEKKAEALGVSEKKTASIVDKFKILGASIGGFASGLTKAFSDPLAIVTSIVGVFGMMVKAALEVDKRVTDMAKNLGISKDGAHALQKNFMLAGYNAEQYNKNLNGALFTIQSQIEATNQLNEGLGTAGLFTEKQLADQVVLTKQMGLEAETATQLQQLSMLQGKSAEKITNEIGDQVVKFRQETGIALNFRKIMTEVTKVSGTLSANLGNDPKRIAAAVIQAQKLGITLEQSRKISSSLLDFESSIQNELEAELLTGKSLNFERARALALQGKTTEAAADLLEQVGGLSEFQKLNVIQQDAIAKSIGMSADEMADAYKQQELLRGTAFATKAAFEEQAKLAAQQGKLEEFMASVKGAANGEELARQAAQIGAQEKFQAAIEKLKETFTEIAGGPLLQMVEKFANFVSNAENLKSIFAGIQKILDIIVIAIGVKLVAGLAKAVIQLGIAAVEAGIMGAGAATAASAVTFGLGAVAIIAALSSIMGAFDGITSGIEAKKVEDAAISPSGGLLISGPKGSFITDPSDQVVAAPNAASMVGGGGGISRADIDAIANRPIAVNVQANTDTLLRLQTAQSQYGAPNSFA
jgi:hypothetical protein